MSSVDIEDGKTKFAADIEKAWKQTCETYLSQSGIDKDSEEWKFVQDTEDPQQVIEVIIETWEHYRNPSKTPAPEEVYSAASTSSTVRKTSSGLLARSKKHFNQLIRRKTLQETLIKPSSSAIRTPHSIIDDRAKLEQKLSAKSPKGTDVVETGLTVTGQLQAIGDSNNVEA